MNTPAIDTRVFAMLKRTLAHLDEAHESHRYSPDKHDRSRCPMCSDMDEGLALVQAIEEGTLSTAMVLKDDKHGDFVAWFADGSVACGVAEKGRDVAIPSALSKSTVGDVVAALREDMMNSKPVYKPIEYKQDSAETRAALCQTMGVEVNTEEEQMRAKLFVERVILTPEQAKANRAYSYITDSFDEESYYLIARFHVCSATGWHFEEYNDGRFSALVSGGEITTRDEVEVLAFLKEHFFI